MGGTLDIPVFFGSLGHAAPCTFNIAVDLRTRVSLEPYKEGVVKVSSRGFSSAEFALEKAPFQHPLGLMFAVASYFLAYGVHIVVESASPPRSALGGSSVAAVALVAAFSAAVGNDGRAVHGRKKTAVVAQAIEASVAGVPCGLQDQLAAAYGGVNAWHWSGAFHGSLYRRQVVVPVSSHERLAGRLLVAYCGRPHESKDINGQWVRQFLSGDNRDLWAEVAHLTRSFVGALEKERFKDAVTAMNRETAVRREMTPGVLDSLGADLVGAAVENACGARFTGAGGGGCLWALGDVGDIQQLKNTWHRILEGRPGARLLDVNIDSYGLMVDD
jgi:D-glycero-alpha-D-manno-heptose-7-phosphate kinase